MRTTEGFGRKIRTLRLRAGLTQAAMAERLQVSASYLNLIEHDRGPVPAGLLRRFAHLLDPDLKALAPAEAAKLAGDLIEVFADRLFEDAPPPEPELRELAVSSPDLARAIVHLHHAYT